ncbi:3-deoxy-D-manno-octulosonic acid transferase [Pseudooceanicola sp. CBS1P-1]|nr:MULTISPECIES: glycosyltransferase N-terminal domain-containing protein [Pseudooceanicola]MBT9383985.1 3-deoxy-D-manno-octulosonic acid transferase [Pseudooceanicola endophyticus]
MTADRPPEMPPRPAGALAWIHCPDPARRKAAEQLALRLLAQEEGLLSVLLTGPSDAPCTPAPGLFCQSEPPEGEDPSGFLDHWHPDALVWLSGYLRPTLLSGARQRAIPMLLAEAEDHALEEPRWRLRASLTRRLIPTFDAFCASTGNAARRLARLGADPEKLEITGPLQEGCGALPFDARLREDLATELTGRPIWLAAPVTAEEVDPILEAQRGMARLAHRVLLILSPADEAAHAAAARLLGDQGWRWCDWREGASPGEETQVLLAEPGTEMGLWYRVAPVCFLARSLVRGQPGTDPYPAAAHGAAILHGPHVRGHLAAYTRLAQAGGARSVRSADSLQQALGRLLSPDQAAAMASAAWQVATEGAETTDRVAGWVIARLEEKGVL